MGRKLLILLGILLCGLAEASNKPPTFVVAQAPSLGREASWKLMSDLLKAVYHRAGFEVVYIRAKNKKALELIKQGKVDALSAKYRDIGDQIAGVTRVDPELFNAPIQMACLDKALCDFTSGKSIGYTRGFEYFKKYCRQEQLNCVEFDGARKMLVALVNGWITSFVTYDINKKDLDSIDELNTLFVTHALEVSLNSHHYVANSKTDIIESLSKAITTLKEEGTIDSMLEQYLSTVYNHQKIQRF